MKKAKILLPLLVFLLLVSLNKGRVQAEEVAKATKTYGTVNVVNPNKADTTVPVIKSFKVNPKKVYTNQSGKNYVDFSAKITDSGSGFLNCWITFTNKDKKHITFYLENGMSTVGKDLYAGRAYIGKGDEGTYKFEALLINDNASNSKTIKRGDKNCPSALKDISFKVVEGKSKKEASLKLVSIEKSLLKLTPKKPRIDDKLVLDIKSSSGRISGATIELIDKKHPSKESLLSYAHMDSDSKFACDLVFMNDKFYAGEWIINKVLVQFEDTESVEFSRAEKNLPSALKKIKIDVSTKTGDMPNDAVYTIKDIGFTCNKYRLGKNGGQIGLRLKINRPGACFIRVVFKDEKTNREILASSYFGDKTKAGYVNIPVYLSNFLGNGSYKIDGIAVLLDNGYSTVYERDLSKVIENSRTTYKKLTTDMLKLNLVVKNTYSK